MVKVVRLTERDVSRASRACCPACEGEGQVRGVRSSGREGASRLFGSWPRRRVVPLILVFLAASACAGPEEVGSYRATLYEEAALALDGRDPRSDVDTLVIQPGHSLVLHLSRRDGGVPLFPHTAPWWSFSIELPREALRGGTFELGGRRLGAIAAVGPDLQQYCSEASGTLTLAPVDATGDSIEGELHARFTCEARRGEELAPLELSGGFVAEVKWWRWDEGGFPRR